MTFNLNNLSNVRNALNDSFGSRTELVQNAYIRCKKPLATKVANFCNDIFLKIVIRSQPVYNRGKVFNMW